MKKKLLFLFVLLIVTMVGRTQVISTITDTTVCSGATTIDIPVKVSSFNAVGSISLKLSYVNAAITSPTIVYKAPGLDAWGTFSSNMATAGTIIISAYDPDVTPPNPGLTLSNNAILFTIRFTIVNISTPSVISFSENSQGNACEYAGVGPDYIPFTDTPFGSYYFEGEALLVPDPVAPGLTKSPNDANVCAGITLTVSTTPGSGGTGTIADEYRYTTNGTGWSEWSATVPSFIAVVGTSTIQSRRTATGIACDESIWNAVSWTVVADPVAPAIVKNPSDAIVCSGQILTINITSGSGGTGTIADEYRYSTDGSTWTTWSDIVPSFAAVAGTNLVQSRRTANGTGCDTSPSNAVSWSVVVDPVAPGITKNPTDASVCADVMLTVTATSGSGGTGTIADEYRFSANNGVDWSAWSPTVPSFAAVPGTNMIQSRRTATGAGCNESSWNQVSWTVNAKQKISGTFNYYNSSGDILLTGADITVKLYRSSDLTHSFLLATDVTDASGYYEFAGTCPDCDYDLEVTSTHNAAGAINTTDAAQANFWGPNAYPIQKVRFHAGDVSGPDLFVGGSDASRIQLNFVNNMAFDRDPWTFWRAGLFILHNPQIGEPELSEYYPKVNLPVGSDVDADMYGLVTGDFNRSFNPNITKAASSSLTLIHEGTRQASTGQVIDLPLRLVDAALIGAVSLVLEYPGEMLVVKDIIMPGAGGNLDWSATGGELRIGWHSNVPLNLARAAEFITLRLETTAAFTTGNSIKFMLAADPLNELADEMYNVISPAVISVEVIEATALGLGDQLNANVFTLNCEPNPFRRLITFSYTLPVEGNVILEINNFLGTKVASLVQEFQAPGNQRLTFDGSALPNGIYLAKLRLKTTDREMIRTIKLVLNK